MDDNTCRNCNKVMFDIDDLYIFEDGHNTFSADSKVKTIIKNDDIFIVCPYCNYHNETIASETKDIGIQYRLK